MENSETKIGFIDFMENDLFDQQIEWFYDNDRKCPICFTDCETDSSKSNERDSSGDVHYCLKCGWKCNEMALWCLEAERRNPYH